MIKTEAWVLHRRSPSAEPGTYTRLIREWIVLEEPAAHQVLIEPVLGCWEGNYGHALQGSPIDVVAQRGDQKIVLGNSGIVRVLRPGSECRTRFKEGDLCLLFPSDPARSRFGFMVKCLAYDAPRTTGLMAKQTVVHETQLIPLPKHSTFSLEQWAAFSGRYVTAWPNFKLAHLNFRSLVSESEYPNPVVWAWGGGVSVAQVELARHFGYQGAVITSDPKRMALLDQLQITSIDRRTFPDLSFDEARYQDDSEFRAKYLASEATFLARVEEATGGQGISIFFDHLGGPLFRATTKALGKPGVIATAGWKLGMKMNSLRAIECMGWHVHVHTHYARYSDALEAIAFAESKGWAPTLNDAPYSWEDIPKLAMDYERGLAPYFPLFRVSN